MYFIELWLIFCKFRSYERSELQVHNNLLVYNQSSDFSVTFLSAFFLTYFIVYLIYTYIFSSFHPIDNCLNDLLNTISELKILKWEKSNKNVGNEENNEPLFDN